ncbi:hypothetical protein HU200_012000 [Digitaria exilis]|uniref:Uncharacterized protein n=1 Tax=Digitaria exilis TaxID=1010633 RepID=A0A835KKW8_9POAL|nr:hypothetical protein HU200_012000 [Digitaria exilis]
MGGSDQVSRKHTRDLSVVIAASSTPTSTSSSTLSTSTSTSCLAVFDLASVFTNSPYHSCVAEPCIHGRNGNAQGGTASLGGDRRQSRHERSLLSGLERAFLVVAHTYRITGGATARRRGPNRRLMHGMANRSPERRRPGQPFKMAARASIISPPDSISLDDSDELSASSSPINILSPPPSSSCFFLPKDQPWGAAPCCSSLPSPSPPPPPRHFRPLRQTPNPPHDDDLAALQSSFAFLGPKPRPPYPVKWADDDDASPAHDLHEELVPRSNPPEGTKFTTNAASQSFLSRAAAEAIPFGSNHLDAILSTFRIPRGVHRGRSGRRHAPDLRRSPRRRRSPHLRPPSPPTALGVTSEPRAVVAVVHGEEDVTIRYARGSERGGGGVPPRCRTRTWSTYCTGLLPAWRFSASSSRGRMRAAGRHRGGDLDGRYFRYAERDAREENLPLHAARLRAVAACCLMTHAL